MILELKELSSRIGTNLSLEKKCFEESQIVRMRSILHAKNAGDLLIEARNKLRAATKETPIETDLGIMTCFKDFYESQKLTKRTVYRYIKLAEHWDIVLKLGMQDESNAQTLGNCMRLVRTLHVIDWYLGKQEQGVDESLLTLDLYWLEQQPVNNGPSKKQLIEQISSLQDMLLETQAELSLLKKENEQLRANYKKIVTQPIHNS